MALGKVRVDVCPPFLKVPDLLLGPENILGAPRLPWVQMDNRPIWVESPVAQSLGLTDQEIVQATVTLERGSMRLWLKNFSFDVPSTWGLKPGDKPFVSVFQTALGYGLHLQSSNLSAGLATPLGDARTPATSTSVHNKGAATGLPPTPAAVNTAPPSATAPTGLKPIGASGASPLDPLLVAQEAQNSIMLGTRVQTLMMQPLSFESAAQLMQPDFLAQLSGQLSAQLNLGGWWAAYRKIALSMSYVSGNALKNMVMTQAKSNERLLSVGENVKDGPKSLLQELLKELQSLDSPDHSELKQTLQRGLNELDASQLQAVQHWTRGDLNLKVVIPFLDADPVDLHFKRKGREQGEAQTPLSVDIHSKSRLLGEVWLNTQISQSSQVDLTMWALRPEVAEMAKIKAKELGFDLQDSGLFLKSFQIFNAAKPVDQEQLSPTALGRVVDAKA